MQKLPGTSACFPKIKFITSNIIQSEFSPFFKRMTILRAHQNLPSSFMIYPVNHQLPLFFFLSPSTSLNFTRLPMLRSKGAIGKNFLYDGLPITNVVDDVISPPVWLLLVVYLQGKEDDDEGNEQAAVKSCRENVVVSGPPADVSILDHLVENVADDGPGSVV